MSSSRKKSRKSSSSRRHDAPVDEWKQFTSPDGHPYYYNAATKESRWVLPTEETAHVKHRRSKGSSKNLALTEQVTLSQDRESLNQDKVPKEGKKKRPESRKSVTEEAPANAVRKSRNAMFQKLQASLEGRLNGPMMGMKGPPPILNIKHETVEVTAQEETKTLSLEDQYEVETAGMSAAERLRFLRKKRQENIMAKRESIAGDDFMAEVASNMRKKGVQPKEKEKINKRPSWKDQEQAEEDRKRQQMQEEKEAKEQEEAKKEREQQVAKEREERRERERERVEQLELEKRQEEERKQRQVEENRKIQEKERNERDSDRESATDAAEVDAHSRSSTVEVPVEEDSDAPSPERVEHRRHSRSCGSKHGNSSLSVGRESVKQVESVEDDHPPAENGHSVEIEVVEDPVKDEKERAREERRARKKREKELASAKPSSVTSESPRRKSTSSSSGLHEESRTRSTSSVEAEEEARAREKQHRREKRQMATMEAALAAQSLERNGGQGNVQREQTQRSEQQPGSSNASAAGSTQAGGYSMNGQPLPGQPPFSGGMYPPYPYAMMPPPPPPPSPYGYYYPYMQPPPMSMPMYPPGMVPPGNQLIPPTPPPSADGMTAASALVPYGADSMLANAYGMNFGGMYGQQSAPELSRCDCCEGIGVGLVEKNGVCAHCNRLRLAFIVDSAQMRQQCSVCGGWGFQLLQANGLCEHCTRQTAQKSQMKLVNKAAARRRSVTDPVTTSVAVAAPRRNLTKNPSKKNDGLDDTEWDKSSSDDSDWDD